MAMTFVPSTSSSFRPTLIRCANSNERRALFSRIAPVYDNLNDLLSLGQHRIWKRMAVSWTGAKMGGPCVGCVLWKWGFVLSLVIGLDFSKDQLLFASSRQESLSKNCFTNIEWVEGDALDLPFSDGWFDAITMGYGLRNVVDKQKAMQEIFRVLKTGSTVSILDFNKSNELLTSAFTEWMIDNIVVPVATGYGLSEEYRYLKSSIREFLTGKELEKLALEVGFSAARHYEIGGGLMGCLVAKR
ncbi:2-phytyl-1,4-beta-naphthoquinone methyltransferase, chloroplastic [Glycine max]|nr:2-phytyl-1,4-beta-naphthoquinone methyltransferase, chloroplastic [Glycine max]